MLISSKVSPYLSAYSYLKHARCVCVLMLLLFFPCFQEHVALWGGRHIEVYALSRDKGVVRQAGKQ